MSFTTKTFTPQLEGFDWHLPLGKIVCVGRNYAAHAAELNNPIPSEPLLFIKPASAAVTMMQPLRLPKNQGEVHYETEIALLIGQPLQAALPEDALKAVYGVGLALDLTLRELQTQLKEKGHPWERAKAWDGACPLSSFIPAARIDDWELLRFSLKINGMYKQEGQVRQMLTPIAELLSFISQYFSLQPGDLVLTGTPAGVGSLCSGDQLVLELDSLLRVNTQVL